MPASSHIEIEINAATADLPDDVVDLVAESRAADIGNMTRLVERWADGSERYDQVGESMLLARSSGRVVGVGGLARCRDVPGALRVRRFYVSTTVRRRGVARRIANTLIESGFLHTDRLTCNARASAAAPPFWEAMGFSPVDVSGITHHLVRGTDH